MGEKMVHLKKISSFLGGKSNVRSLIQQSRTAVAQIRGFDEMKKCKQEKCETEPRT